MERKKISHTLSRSVCVPQGHMSLNCRSLILLEALSYRHDRPLFQVGTSFEDGTDAVVGSRMLPERQFYPISNLVKFGPRKAGTRCIDIYTVGSVRLNCEGGSYLVGTPKMLGIYPRISANIDTASRAVVTGCIGYNMASRRRGRSGR